MMKLLHSNKFLVLLLFPLVSASDLVHIRSGTFGQIVTSSALRWAKVSHANEPVTTPSVEPRQLCRLGAGKKIAGTVENDVCKVVTSDGEEEDSTSYQLLSGHAAQTKWVPWQRPQSPPVASVALSQNIHRFVAFDQEENSVGYLDPKSNLGSCVFPGGVKTQCLILTEVEPTGYQMTDIELKAAKGFSQEDVILATDTLAYISPDSSEYSTGGGGGGKSRTEKVLTYRLQNQLDFWGQGHLMAKGLHTTVKIPLPDGSDYQVKIVEWGIPSLTTDEVVTVPVWEDLSYGTGVNVTIRGVRRKGEMSYWANLRTNFKDGSFTIRHIVGERRVDLIEGITTEKSRLFHLSDGSIVAETTTLKTTSLETTQLMEDVEEGQQQDMGSQSATEPVALAGHSSQNLQMSSSDKIVGSLLFIPTTILAISLQSLLI